MQRTDIHNPNFSQLIRDLKNLRSSVSGPIRFSTSLGKEDQVLTAAISASGEDIEIFTLETGRLFPQSLELLERTIRKWGYPITVFYPDTTDVENYVNKFGINAFYTSKDLRQSCCEIRKIHPLKRALAGADVWMTGLRGDQSTNRTKFSKTEYDERFKINKFNPLINWSLQEIDEIIETMAIPINPLHKEGYVSIGCAPCTRAITSGEPERAGRWWWEDSKKECGLHTS